MANIPLTQQEKGALIHAAVELHFTPHCHL